MQGGRVVGEEILDFGMQSGAEIRLGSAGRGREGEIQRLIETYGFIEPQLFDSVARGDDHGGSDLDPIATIPPVIPQS